MQKVNDEISSSMSMDRMHWFDKIDKNRCENPVLMNTHRQLKSNLSKSYWAMLNLKRIPMETYRCVCVCVVNGQCSCFISKNVYYRTIFFVAFIFAECVGHYFDFRLCRQSNINWAINFPLSAQKIGETNQKTWHLINIIAINKFETGITELNTFPSMSV